MVLDRRDSEEVGVFIGYLRGVCLCWGVSLGVFYKGCGNWARIGSLELDCEGYLLNVIVWFWKNRI